MGHLLLALISDTLLADTSYCVAKVLVFILDGILIAQTTALN